MRLVLFVVAFLSASSLGNCQVPTPAVHEQKKIPADLEGLYWNKWDTKNFVIISLDKNRGYAMRQEAELVRAAVLNRWSLPEGSHDKCKVVIVPNPKMLKRLFGLSEPKCEVNASESAIWIDEDRIQGLSSLVAESELLRGDFKPFLKRGIPLLEGSPSRTRAELSSSLEMRMSSFLSPGTDGSESDATKNSALLCLLVRKEFGLGVFGKVVSDPSKPLHEILGFSSESDLESTYARYRSNLLSDIKGGITPDKYLIAPR